jgi:Bacterial RNA polymerase, alpha chain C terminal domain
LSSRENGMTSSLGQCDNNHLLELSLEVRNRSIRAMHLPVRAVNALEAAGIWNIGKLIDDARQGLSKVRGISLVTSSDIQRAIINLSRSTTSEGDIDWIRFARNSGFLVLPEALRSAPIDFSQSLPKVLFEAIKARFGSERADIVAQYALRPEESAIDLYKLAKILGVTRQAVNLTKDIVVTSLRGAILDDDYTDCCFRFDDSVVTPLRLAKQRLVATGGRPLFLSEWQKIFVETLLIAPEDLKRLNRPLCLLLGYHKIILRNKKIDSIFLPVTRPGGPFVRAVSRADRLLRLDHPMGLSRSQLIKKLNLGRKTEPSIDELPLVIAAVADVEFDPRRKYYRIKQASMARMSHRLERILHEKGKPTHIADLAYVVWHPNAGKGLRQTQINISQVMSDDKRFVPIGKSGFWTLLCWGVETRKITDLAAAFLRTAAEPMTEEKIYSFILAKRPIRRNSLLSMLREDGRFCRIAPRTWKLKS